MFEARKSLEGLIHTFLYSQEFIKNNPAGSPTVSSHKRVEDRILIHLHIPKTAGTSLTTILAQNYPDGTRKGLNPDDLSKPADVLKNEFRDIKLTYGHLPHGVANLIGRKHLYICALRRPGPRILSYYNYIKNTVNHPVHKHLVAKSMSFGTFLEWASDPQNVFRKEINNGQVRQLAGLAAPNDARLEKDLLPLAISHLLGPDMIFGLTEMFDDFLDALRSQKIITKLNRVTKNASPYRVDFDGFLKELSPKHKEIYDDFTRWDNILYDVGKNYYVASKPQAPITI